MLALSAPTLGIKPAHGLRYSRLFEMCNHPHCGLSPHANCPAFRVAYCPPAEERINRNNACYSRHSKVLDKAHAIADEKQCIPAIRSSPTSASALVSLAACRAPGLRRKANL
jgi:hypothetical protein